MRYLSRGESNQIEMRSFVVNSKSIDFRFIDRCARHASDECYIGMKGISLQALTRYRVPKRN